MLHVIRPLVSKSVSKKMQLLKLLMQLELCMQSMLMGIPQDAAGVVIPQASQAIRIRDLAMGYMHLLPHMPPVIAPPVVPAPPPVLPVVVRFCFESRTSCCAYCH